MSIPALPPGECRNEPLTVLALMRGFMEYAVRKGKATFPPFYPDSGRLWNVFFYEVTKELGPRFPVLACIKRFNWDGPYPKLAVMGEMMAGLGLITLYD